MMQAVAQVYEQPEVELDEIVRNLRPGESVKEYEERKAESFVKNGIRLFPIVVPNELMHSKMVLLLVNRQGCNGRRCSRKSGGPKSIQVKLLIVMLNLDLMLPKTTTTSTKY